ncbi:phage tail protein [Roseovarius sp. MS2]|uniref:phage tail protein n=1 Tax=Roseovarius sp. MS2 TaxID=3390728 RepID=UPI003EDC78BE
MRLLLWITALVLASAAPASAGPVAGLVAAVFAGVTVKAVALFALRLFAGVGLSILQQRRARRGRNAAFGLQVTATTRGELESETSIIGLYATKGHLIYHNSHGPNNKYYQTVIELGGLPGAGFNRVMVDGVYSELGEEEHPDYGFPLIAKRDQSIDYAWIKVYDGTQTAADPTLVAKYAEDPETPWTEAHIGRGIPYAILTMEVSSKVWPNGAPEQRYEARGIPFYDLRRDSTAGGTGPHRWDDPTTWEPTRNPVVKIYNILRGLRLYDGSVWGGEAEAEDLPGWNWVPAMNACDADLGGRPKYEAGYEIRFAEDTPHDVIGELQAACNAQMTEFGGFFYIQVDAPDIPVAVITDDDLLVTDAATKDPFPELLEIYNRVTAKYVSPGALWNGVPLDQIRNAAWEAEDGIARNFEMDLPAVFNPGQAGQLAQSALKDHRRWRRHTWPLPPDYAGLRPLNTVAVTSAWNDYTDKLFEVTEIVLDLHRLTVVASLREREPEDFEPDTTLEIPDRSSILPRPVPTDAGLPFFNAAARTVTNAEGTRAHAAVDVTWDASGIAETIKGIAIECQKRETEEEVWSGTVLDVERGLATIQPVPPLTDLRVRAKALSDNRRGTWSAWIWVTTDDVRVAAADLADTLTAVVVPSGLAVSSTLVTDGVARVSANWAAVANAVGYEVGITEGGNEIVLSVGNPGWSAQVVPGAALSVRVRAVSAVGNKSGWTAARAVTAPVDTIAPATPSGLAATGVFEGIWLRWTANTEGDLARYEIVERVSTSGPGASTVPTYVTTSPQFISEGLINGETLNYWVRAVDTSGNKSGWTARASATARKTGDVITNEALRGLIDATSFAAGIEPVTIVTALPATKLTETVVFAGKLYRWSGTAYVATVPAGDLTGQLTDAQIAAVSAAKLTGQIQTPQIATGAITDAKIAGLAASKVTGQLADVQIAALSAAKLTGAIASPQIANGAVTDAKIAGIAASKVTGQLTDGQVSSISAAKLTGQITGTQITDSSITTPKIATGAVTASQIAAATITGDKIAANTISAEKITSGTITSAQIAAGTIQASNIAADTITGDKIAAATITSSELATGSVTAVKIAAATITGDKIAGTTITGDKIAANTITAAKIASGTITSAQIAAGTIQASNIAADTITGDKIAASAITSSEIATGAITAVKIASATITGDKIAAGTITANNIAAATVTAAKIAAGTITGDKISVNTITSALIATGAVQAAQVASGAITAGKLAIGSFTNLNQDEDFTDPSAWTNPTGLTWQASGNSVAWGSTNLARLEGDAGSYVVPVSKFYFELDPEGESLFFEFFARIISGTGMVYADLQLANNPSFSGVSGTDYTFRNVGNVTSTSITKKQGVISVPPGFRYARIRLIKGNNGTTSCFIGGVSARRMNTGKLIVDGTVQARHIDVNDLVVAGLATINAAYVKDANISGTLSAAKLTAGSALAATITVNGTALSTTTTRAADPAARINAATTQIDPGKIVISGATTLADWRKGGDETRIDGGSISANTISANKIAIGSRNVTPIGITFSTNGNVLSWTSGFIRYVGDDGALATQAITGGSTTYSSSWLYIYWTQGSPALSVTGSPTTAFTSEKVVLAQYRGGTNLDQNYGRTIIDGDFIKTGAIDASHIAANTITATEVAANAITTAKINGRAVTDPQTFFENYGGGTKTPATSPNWNNATSFSIVVPDSGSILLIDCHVNWLLNGGTLGASWGLRFLLNGVAFDSMGGSYFQELAPFRRAISVGAGTHTVVLQCQRSSTASFLIQNVHTVATILKR